jgi:hypothetical protein
LLNSPAISSERTATASGPANNRSKIGNGTKMVRGVDGRSADGRRFRELFASYAAAADLGDIANLTEPQRALVNQAASLTIQSERFNGAMLRCEVVDIDQAVRVANLLGRALRRLGIKHSGKAKPKSLVVALAEAAR